MNNRQNNRQLAALMIAGTVVMIGLICAGCWAISTTLRLWGLA